MKFEFRSSRYIIHFVVEPQAIIVKLNVWEPGVFMDVH